MQHEQKEFECLYEKDKPLRDKVRETIHNKILTVDEVITELYKIVDEEQKRNKEKNDMQDVQMEELKALIQEVASHQQITHTDMDLLKQATLGLEAKMDRTDQEVKDLRARLENGWKKDLIDKLVEAQTNANQEAEKRKTTTTIETEKRRTTALMELLKIIGTAVGTGGVIYLLLQNMMKG